MDRVNKANFMSHSASLLRSFKQKVRDTYFHPFWDNEANKFVGTYPEGIDPVD